MSDDFLFFLMSDLLTSFPAPMEYNAILNLHCARQRECGKKERKKKKKNGGGGGVGWGGGLLNLSRLID